MVVALRSRRAPPPRPAVRFSRLFRRTGGVRGGERCRRRRRRRGPPRVHSPKMTRPRRAPSRRDTLSAAQDDRRLRGSPARRARRDRLRPRPARRSRGWRHRAVDPGPPGRWRSAPPRFPSPRTRKPSRRARPPRRASGRWRPGCRRSPLDPRIGRTFFWQSAGRFREARFRGSRRAQEAPATDPRRELPARWGAAHLATYGGAFEAAITGGEGDLPTGRRAGRRPVRRSVPGHPGRPSCATSTRSPRSTQAEQAIVHAERANDVLVRHRRPAGAGLHPPAFATTTLQAIETLDAAHPGAVRAGPPVAARSGPDRSGHRRRRPWSTSRTPGRRSSHHAPGAARNEYSEPPHAPRRP